MVELDRIEGGVGLASEAGLTDADYVLRRSEWLDAAFIGGIHADGETREAALEMVDRGRDEFMYDDAFDFVRREFERLEDSEVVPGVNVRSSSPEPLTEMGRIVDRHDGLLEINAHCRQPEMVEAGCGHSLLRDTDELRRRISAAAESGATVGAKIRAEVDGVEIPEVTSAVECSGDFLHIDCMDSPGVIDSVAHDTDLLVIANNGVRSREDVDDYLERGADMVSTARGARSVD
ncbi:MAG: dihydropyrimidine dehydrogenase, partial [Halobacteria archaeon]|nr:dihydropyrimidine dehydrogenase [Halobacteria archaeon]